MVNWLEAFDPRTSVLIYDWAYEVRASEKQAFLLVRKATSAALVYEAVLALDESVGAPGTVAAVRRSASRSRRGSMRQADFLFSALASELGVKV